MMETPTYLQDAKHLLGERGFVTSNTWYHCASTVLLASISQQGLKRSGDSELKAATRKTMATIGDSSFAETDEPLFLTQSRELAFYWAQQKVRERLVRLQGDEQPVVLAVTLPPQINEQVRPDVGAASLLLLAEGERFMAHLAGIYQQHGFGVPEIDLRKANRMEYLQTLGMAYIDADIDAGYVEVVSD